MINQTDLTHNLLGALFQASPSLWTVLLCFFVNFLLTGLIVLSLVNLVSIDVNKQRRAFSFLLMGIGTFIPLIGIFVVLLVTLLLKKYGKDFYPIEVNTYHDVEYSRKNPIKTVAYGTGWADIRLNSSKFSQDERKQALQSISRGLPKDANLIYSKLVSDDLEELRICSFSMLEIQQDYLQSKINLLLKKHQDNTDPKKKAFLAKLLALLYWELVYRNLSDQEFRSILLERSSYFANQSLAVLSDDATLLILISKINIQEGKLEESLQNLKKAAAFQAPASKIIPYLAELAYENKDYKTVKQLLNSDHSLRYIFKINKIVNFWCK